MHKENIVSYMTNWNSIPCALNTRTYDSHEWTQRSMFIFRHGCSLCAFAGSGMRDWNCFWFLLNFVKIVFVQHYQKTFKYLFLKCQLGLTNYSSCVCMCSSVMCLNTSVCRYICGPKNCLFEVAWKFPACMLENFLPAWKFLENFLPAWKFHVSVIYYKFSC